MDRISSATFDTVRQLVKLEDDQSQMQSMGVRGVIGSGQLSKTEGSLTACFGRSLDCFLFSDSDKMCLEGPCLHQFPLKNQVDLIYVLLNCTTIVHIRQCCYLTVRWTACQTQGSRH